MIYVIGERRTGEVKIGTAVDPVARLAQLQNAHPRRLVLQLALPGNEREEKHLHRAFASKRLLGEWFDFGDEDAVIAVATASAAPLALIEDAAVRPTTRKRRKSRQAAREPATTLRHVRAAFASSPADWLPTSTLLEHLRQAAPKDGWLAMGDRAAAMALATDLYACSSLCRPVKGWIPAEDRPVQGYRFRTLPAAA